MRRGRGQPHGHYRGLPSGFFRCTVPHRVRHVRLHPRQLLRFLMGLVLGHELFGLLQQVLRPRVVLYPLAGLPNGLRVFRLQRVPQLCPVAFFLLLQVLPPLFHPGLTFWRFSIGQRNLVHGLRVTPARGIVKRVDHLFDAAAGGNGPGRLLMRGLPVRRVPSLLLRELIVARRRLLLPVPR